MRVLPPSILLLGLCVTAGPTLAQSSAAILGSLVPSSARAAVTGPGRGVPSPGSAMPTYRSQPDRVEAAPVRPVHSQREQQPVRVMAPAAARQPLPRREAAPPQTAAASMACADDRGNTQEGSGQICMAIEFLSGQAILRPGAKEILDRFGQALNDPQLKNFRFLIEGHTDTVGTAEYNRELSAQRAQVVADHLRERGVLPARLEIIS